MNGIPASQPINSTLHTNIHTNTRANIHANRVIQRPPNRRAMPKKPGKTSSSAFSGACHTPIKVALIMRMSAPVMIILSAKLGGVSFLTDLGLFLLLFPFVIAKLAIAKMVLDMIFGR